MDEFICFYYFLVAVFTLWVIVTLFAGAASVLSVVLLLANLAIVATVEYLRSRV